MDMEDVQECCGIAKTLACTLDVEIEHQFTSFESLLHFVRLKIY
jgi:hypothetical protein